MLLARTAKQLPQPPETPGIKAGRSSAEETAALVTVLKDRIKYLERAVGKIINTLGISVESEREQSFPTIKFCMAVAVEHFGVDVRDILSPSHNARLADIRHVAMYVTKYLTIKTYPEIGHAFSRDHTTVMHAVRKIETKRKVDTMLDKDVADIMREIRTKYLTNAPSGALEAAPPVSSPVAERAASL